MHAQILSILPADHPWRDRIRWFDCTDSTNTQAKLLAAAGAPHGTVLIADRQTGGRGRMGRSFQSPGGMGIYLSVILRPDCRADALMHLTCATAVAMCDAAEQATQLRPSIKWTNDLVVGTKKLGGILTELSVDPKTGNADYAVIGIGLNCCQRAVDFSPELQDMATSLSMASGQPVDRAAMAVAMIQALYSMDCTLLSGRAAMLDAYRRDCITLGKDVVIVRGDERRYAAAEDIAGDGALIVTYADGTREAVSSGEVSVRGMYGYV